MFRGKRKSKDRHFCDCADGQIQYGRITLLVMGSWTHINLGSVSGRCSGMSLRSRPLIPDQRLYTEPKINADCNEYELNLTRRKVRLYFKVVVFSLRGPGRWMRWYANIFTIRVRVAVQNKVFRPFSLEPSVQILGFFCQKQSVNFAILTNCYKKQFD